MILKILMHMVTTKMMKMMTMFLTIIEIGMFCIGEGKI